MKSFCNYPRYNCGVVGNVVYLSRSGRWHPERAITQSVLYLTRAERCSNTINIASSAGKLETDRD
jgi:hypothetical protein